MEQAVLDEYFQAREGVLLAQYQNSKLQHAAKNKGANREDFCRLFLDQVLPFRLRLTTGEVWDCYGCKTGELDLVVVRDDCPRLTFDGGQTTCLVEGVHAAIEVKSNLTRDKLREALVTLKNVQNLVPLGLVQVMEMGRTIARPLRVVVAYEGASWDVLLDELGQPGNAGVIDLVCLLGRGVIASSKLQGSQEPCEYYCVERHGEALLTLYGQLTTFAVSLSQFHVDLRRYFLPQEHWQDNWPRHHDYPPS